MIQQRICPLINSGLHLQHSRFLSTTNSLCLIQKWRKERGLPLNPNRSGVLTDGPDYTFLDGRLTPLGMNQTQRILKEREINKQIIQLTKEVDFAVERHKRLQIEAENQKKRILDKKLKPKGLELLKSK